MASDRVEVGLAGSRPVPVQGRQHQVCHAVHFCEHACSITLRTGDYHHFILGIDRIAQVERAQHVLEHTLELHVAYSRDIDRRVEGQAFFGEGTLVRDDVQACVFSQIFDGFAQRHLVRVRQCHGFVEG